MDLAIVRPRNPTLARFIKHFYFLRSGSAAFERSYVNYGREEDAYAWHLGEMRVGESVYRTYEASGNGGQLLIVAPELDLAVVFTGGNYRQGDIWGRWRDEIIAAEIVSRMKD